MAKKYFDLHFEIGIADSGATYAKTFIGGKEIRREDRSVVNAVASVCLEAHSMSLWNKIANDPTLSKFPFPGSSNPAANNAKTNGRLFKPSELTQVPHPDCQAQCSSYDIFGKVKCSSMCQQRRGV